MMTARETAIAAMRSVYDEEGGTMGNADVFALMLDAALESGVLVLADEYQQVEEWTDQDGMAVFKLNGVVQKGPLFVKVEAKK